MTGQKNYLIMKQTANKKSELPLIKFKGKKICLLTNYRTASTYFIRETFFTNKIPPTGNWEHFNNRNFLKAYKELKPVNKFILKLMPDQIDHAYEKFEALNTLCDEIVYLYRRDFEAQAKSWVAWNLSGDHEHHWGEEKQFNISTTQAVADVYTNQLIENYKFMKQIFKKYPGSVYCMEDFPVQRPYNRKYNWLDEVKIQPFNTHKEVFRS